MKKPRILDDYIKEYQRKLKIQREKVQKYKRPKLFNLNQESIMNILNNNIKVKYPELTYKIDKASYTNSYYIMFFYGDIYITARISDHESKRGALGIVVNENTTKKEVIEALEQRIVDLKYKYKAKSFNKFKEIEKEKP